jgi:hypothetical protein
VGKVIVRPPWGMDGPFIPSAASPSSPSYLPARGIVQRANRCSHRTGEGKFGKASGLDNGKGHPTQPEFSDQSGTSWLFSHVQRGEMPAFPTGREGGECIGKAASAYLVGAWWSSTHSRCIVCVAQRAPGRPVCRIALPVYAGPGISVSMAISFASPKTALRQGSPSVSRHD